MTIKSRWNALKAWWGKPSVERAMAQALVAAEKADHGRKEWVIEQEMSKQGFRYDMRKGVQSEVNAYDYHPK